VIGIPANSLVVHGLSKETRFTAGLSVDPAFLKRIANCHELNYISAGSAVPMPNAKPASTCSGRAI
jgi:hypothetical protein